MKIHEYQAREIFLEYGIPVVPGFPAASVSEAEEAAEEIGFPVVIKAQVLSGGRGKQGGIKAAQGKEDLRAKINEVFALTIGDFPVRKVFIAKAAKIEQEFYLGLTVDRNSKKIILMASAGGGVEIETLASREPEKIFRLYADPFSGFSEEELHLLLNKVFLNQTLAANAKDIVLKLYSLFLEKGCSLAEINPLAKISSPDALYALDSKINFDDNALPLHPELLKYYNKEEHSEDERKAINAGLHFISLDGDIGCIVNGAGLAMATMDMIKYYGASPANFLDVGGSSNPEKVLTALKVILSIPRVNGILFNIFGGITRCDDIARGILLAREQIEIGIPIVIRLIGTNDQEGRMILKNAGLQARENLDEAVKDIILAASKGEDGYEHIGR